MMSDFGISDFQVLVALGLGVLATLIVGFIVVARRLDQLGDCIHRNVFGLESSVDSIEREVTKESREQRRRDSEAEMLPPLSREEEERREKQEQENG